MLVDLASSHSVSMLTVTGKNILKSSFGTFNKVSRDIRFLCSSLVLAVQSDVSSAFCLPGH